MNNPLNKTIYFDMDGTLANFYGVNNWLEKILNSNTEPYAKAQVLITEKQLLALMNKGYKLAIISWLCGGTPTKEYNKAVRQVKREWLKKHYPQITFSEIHIIKHGTPKSKVAKYNTDILIDDEIKNRVDWNKNGLALAPNEIDIL